MTVNINPMMFSKKELEECSDETYQKLKVYLPRCKEDVHLNMDKT